MTRPDCYGNPGNWNCNQDCGNLTTQLCLSWSKEMRERRAEERKKDEVNNERFIQAFLRKYNYPERSVRAHFGIKN